MPGAFVISSKEGFILVRVAAGEAEILTLAVAPDARSHGVGAALVTTAATHAQQCGATELFLEVAVSNAAARALYSRLGFAENGRRKGYYVTQGAELEDALLLRSRIPLSPLGKTPPPR
jgi:ribosomal-protein-alanine N-acetyltransferase